MTGRVKQLEIENFKSYRGLERIGPFKEFTTIIGPNGSGKSNLMDAISFVLGVRTGVLRGNSLRELIYVNTESEDPADRPDRAQVTLVFETQGQKEVRFSRAIVPSQESYVSQYRLDGKTVSAETYNAKLESFGILVKARNFLVFQGDIENVAQMSPKDLTNLFETISGSAAIKKEYEEAETKLKDAEALMTVVYSKRKAIMAEKKQKREQKAEAEKHMGLVSQLEEMKIKKMLWKLYHLVQDSQKAKEDLEKIVASVAGAEKEAHACEEEAEKERRKHAGIAKEALMIDKKMKKKRAEVEKRIPELINVKEEIAHLHRRMKGLEKERDASKTKATEHAERLKSLKKQLEQLKDAKNQVEREIQQSKDSQMSLSSDLLQEYNEIKREYGTKAAALEAELSSLKASQEADEESHRILEDSVSSMRQRIQELEESMANDASKIDHAKLELERLQTERQNTLSARDELRSERRKVEARRSQLERKLEETEGTLREAKAESKQNQREEAMRRLVDDLKKAYPSSVYGIVTDLADPTSDRYKLAMSVAMGRDLDSVVVDTPETAMKCIQLVKDRRLPPMTFLPADTIKAREINPALRALGGTSKLAIDCLRIKDDRATRAFHAICADALLCDSVDEARQLAYHGEVRQKVIALDGTAFLKNGLITGGMTSAIEARARKWDQEKVGQLKMDRNNIADELNSLPQIRDITQKLQAADAKASGLENELDYTNAELKSMQAKIRETKSNIQALNNESDSKKPKMNELEKQISARNKKMKSLHLRMEEIANSLFKEFVTKIGVTSIKEYEDKHLREVERLTERKAAIVSQIARVKNQIDYESAADPETAVLKASQDLEKLQHMVAKLETEAKEIDESNKKSRQELDELSKSREEMKKSLDKMDAGVKELKEKARKALDEVAARKRGIASLQSKIEQLRMSQNDVIENAELENIQLPTADGPPASRGTQKRARDADKGLPMVTPSVDNIDFSSLVNEDLLRDIYSRKARESEMNAAIEEISTQLSTMAPNLKAVEQFEEIKDREKEQLEEVEATKRELKTIDDHYSQLRQRRFDLFNAALTHISECIDPIYKELTRSSVHPSGGQAYLSPENAEEPFTGGIKFSAMPPTKRFRDMEQLSGGEKTVAALALLFAIHSFHPSPFFVLDEIDAALDSSNVARVALYLRSKTRPGTPGSFQGIVISLKDVFYEKADALVGVCREPKHRASSTLTFDLSSFGPPMGTTS